MRLYTVFSELLNMNLTASYIILFVLAARLALRKAPKVFSYLLWAAVLFRLLCPVAFPSAFSLLRLWEAPVTQTGSIGYIPPDLVLNSYPQPESSDAGISPNTSHGLLKGGNQLVEAPAVPSMAFAVCIWLAGAALLLLHSIVSLVRLRRSLTGAIPLRDNILLADHINSAFVLGFMRPRIYLPSFLPEKEQDYIIRHEQYHIRRLDHIIRLLAFMALCLHWFNPLVWVAFTLSGRDMEMSCDEAVIKCFGDKIRSDYSASLLGLATGRRIRPGTPLAFGGGDTKSRIRNIMKWKKPALWSVAAAAALCVIVVAACVTNPKGAAPLSPGAEEACIVRTSDNAVTAKWYPEGNFDFKYEELPVITIEDTDTLIFELSKKNDSLTVGEDYYEYNGSSGSCKRETYKLERRGSGEFALEVSRRNHFQQESAVYYIMSEKGKHVVRVLFPLNEGADSASKAGTASGTENSYNMNAPSDMDNSPGMNVPSGINSSSDTDAVFRTDNSSLTSSSGLAAMSKGISPSLNTAVSEAVMSHFQNDSSDVFACESHVILDYNFQSHARETENGSDLFVERITVYAMVLYQEFKCEKGTLSDAGGIHQPAVITFDIYSEAPFLLNEYWEPGDGSYYVQDIKEKFPPEIVKDALDTQKYILPQLQSCYAQAVAYFELDTDAIIEGLFDIIMDSPASSSAPADYIAAHPIEYRELTYYGNATLQYLLRQFLGGGQTGLKGQLMWYVLEEMTGIKAPDLPAGNGQEAFDQCEQRLAEALKASGL